MIVSFLVPFDMVEPSKPFAEACLKFEKAQRNFRSVLNCTVLSLMPGQVKHYNSRTHTKGIFNRERSHGWKHRRPKPHCVSNLGASTQYSQVSSNCVRFGRPKGIQLSSSYIFEQVLVLREKYLRGVPSQVLKVAFITLKQANQVIPVSGIKIATLLFLVLNNQSAFILRLCNSEDSPISYGVTGSAPSCKLLSMCSSMGVSQSLQGSCLLRGK